MTPRQYLQQLQRIDALIESAVKELQQLREWTDSLTADNDITQNDENGCPDDEREKLRIKDPESTLRWEIKALVAKKEEIRKTIDSLRDGDERLLLRLRYIEGRSWDMIANDMSCSMTHLRRLHDRALKHIRLSKPC